VPARAIDLLPERLAIAQTREQSALIETLQRSIFASGSKSCGAHRSSRHPPNQRAPSAGCRQLPPGNHHCGMGLLTDAALQTVNGDHEGGSI
jgi:hypothetical protein